jgi:hypothetical protein
MATHWTGKTARAEQVIFIKHDTRIESGSANLAVQNITSTKADRQLNN